MTSDSSGIVFSNLPVSLDFETFYDKEYSVKNMPVYQYVRHPQFDAYLLAVWAPDICWVGHPRKMPVAVKQRIKGSLALAHNATFDSVVYAELERLGIFDPADRPAGWFCTADMVAYLRCQRDLATAARVLLGVEVDKALRSQMQGITPEVAAERGLSDALNDYASHDAKMCYQLFDKYNAQWPEHEQRMSALNRIKGAIGITADKASVDAAVELLTEKRRLAEIEIPWDWSDCKTPLSPKAISLQCRECEIPFPASLAKDDAGCLAWEAEYAETYTWVKAIRDWRRINMLLGKVKTLQAGIKPEDGRFPYSLKYFGAATGRFSGSEKFNIQNLPKDNLFDINLRGMFRPDPGCVFGVYDSGQIEARALRWLVGDTDILDMIRAGFHIYKAYGTKYLGAPQDPKWSTEDYPEMYALAKAVVLGAGYGCGPAKFKSVAKLMAGLDLTAGRAAAVVKEFRATNPKIVQFWYQLHRDLQQASIRGEASYTIRLPSGRPLVYHNPRSVSDGSRDIYASFFAGATPRKVYGGLLTENVIQALCRDILVDRTLALEDAGFDVRFTVHDEWVINLKQEQATAETDAQIRKITTTSPSWCSDLPLGVKGNFVNQYMKD